MLVWDYDCKSYYAAYNENLVNAVTAKEALVIIPSIEIKPTGLAGGLY